MLSPSLTPLGAVISDQRISMLKGHHAGNMDSNQEFLMLESSHTAPERICPLPLGDSGCSAFLRK